jgi:c-di-GMP-binding flagellar brake protein YcgR
LVEVDAAQNLLYIDELVPEKGNEAISNGEIFSVRALSRGVPVFFRYNRIISVESDGGSFTYKIPFPKELIYRQRRQFFRTTVGLTQDCDMLLTSSMQERPALRGRVTDLSQVGAGIQIPGQVVPEFALGESLTECEISLPEYEYMNCQAEVRHVHYDEARDVSSCGLLFHQLEKNQQRKLDRYVYQLQREARKSPGA